MKVVFKQWAGTLSALTIILAVLCVAAPAMAATWVVNPDGTGDFTTIQAAVDSNWTSGDTIQIEYAVYQESVYVDAEGKYLSIVGVPSADGSLPVIDGMGGAMFIADSMDDTVDGLVCGGCGACSMYLYDGNFTATDLCLINASHNGLVARAGNDGEVFSATGIEVTENGWYGMNVMYFAEATLTDIMAYENDYSGIHMKSNEYSEVMDVVCYDNYGAGLHIRGDQVVVDNVEATGNDWRGVFVCLENGYYDEAFDNPVIEPPEPSECTLTNILVANNYGDGLFVKDEGNHYVDISWIESTGNADNGIALNNLDGFSASYLVLSENGWTDVPVVVPRAILASASVEHQADCGNDEMLDESCSGLGYGNGIGVLWSGNGNISYVESINNSVAGVYLKRTNDITLRYVEAAEHSCFFPYRMDTGESYGVTGAGISEKITGNTVIEDCLSYNNWVDYAYEGQCDQDMADGVDQEPSLRPFSYSTITGLQISDPIDETVVPTILSWQSDCDLLWLGQPGGAIDNFYAPFRYNSAGGIYADVMGSSGGTIILAFDIPSEFPYITAEGLSTWNLDWSGEDYGWVQPAETFNIVSDDNERQVGAFYAFPEFSDQPLGSIDSFDAVNWGIPAAASGMDGYSGDSYETQFAPFWYVESGGDDGGSGVTGNSTSGIGSVSGDGATPTPTPTLTPTPTPTVTPTAESDDEKDDGNVTPTMTPGPVGGSASPTVPVTQMPADAGASGSGGFLPWIVLIVVLVAIAGGVYYTKNKQK